MESRLFPRAEVRKACREGLPSEQGTEIAEIDDEVDALQRGKYGVRRCCRVSR